MTSFSQFQIGKTYLQCNKSGLCLLWGRREWLGGGMEWVGFLDVGYETFVFKSKAGFRNVFTL